MSGSAALWAGAALSAVVALVLLRKPLAAMGRLLVRTGAGLCCLWAFNGVGALIGVRLGVNLLNALVLGTLGVPGLGLLLLCRWVLG